MNVFDQVAEFHYAFSIPIYKELTPPDDDHQKLRIALLDEEYKEFLKAYAENDFVEMADGLGDMTYIICGTAHAYGVALNNGWEPSYVDDVEPVGKYDKEEVDNRIVIFQIMYETYLLLEKHRDYDGIRDSMFAMMNEIAALAMLLNIPFRKVFAEIHKSNMAKLMPDGSVKRRADNKVMKPEGWKPPDIKSILYPEKVA